MPKCEDCEEPVVFLRKPEGGWLPPVEPIFDFAYNDHYLATIEGVAQPVPQVYRKHQCLTFEERQLKRYNREVEKRDLIEADRQRRAEEARVALELAQAREAQREREERERLETERAVRAAQEAERQRKYEETQQRRFEKDLRVQFTRAAEAFPTRLLTIACDDCGAEVGEACRDHYCYGNAEASAYQWWKRQACNSRYAAGPPDDRSKIRVIERWGEDYDEATGQGTTPWTVGPWPPSIADGGRYDMQYWLRMNYFRVFDPENASLTIEEEATLSAWLVLYGEIFEEVESDGPGDVVEADAEPGIEGVRGRDAEGEGDPEAEGDRVDPEGQEGECPSTGEQADHGEGTQWLRRLGSKPS